MRVGKRRFSDPLQRAQERVAELSRAAQHTVPAPRYLDQPVSSEDPSPLISDRQREVVVKYINELAEDFELAVQTGTLACNYFDRYVATLNRAKAPDGGKRLIQMIASTCLLIAAKFSDRKLPPLSELEKVHHGKAQAEEFAHLELQILQGLQWKLHVPLPHAFIEPLRALCVNASFSGQIEERMLFFIDLSVYGYHFLCYPPAAIAAAAIITAWKFSDEHESVPEYLPVLASACGIEHQRLSTCVNALVRYYQSCFPESAEKAAQSQSQSLFIPISSQERCDSAGGSCDSPTTAAQAETPTLLRRDAPTFGTSEGPPEVELVSPRSDASSASTASLPPTPTEGAPPAVGAAANGAAQGATTAADVAASDKRKEEDLIKRRTPDSILDVNSVC